MDWRALGGAAGLSLAVGLLARGAEPRPRFVDATASAGLDIVTFSGGPAKDHIVESTGNGVLILDYDGDRHQDLYFVNAHRFPERGRSEPHSNRLYRNRGDGTFADVTEAAGVGSDAFGVGGAVGDFDNDGLPDIYVTNWGPNVLFRNNGDGTFADVTRVAGVGDPRWSMGATFFDADNDGDADLFVGSYIETSWEEVHAARRTRLWRGKVLVLDGPRGLPGSRNTFYLNQGDGTFADRTENAGFAEGATHYTMGVVSFDYDGDADVDVYAANDSTPNCLYRNRGDGTFEEIAALTGAAYNADGAAQGSMGVEVGDFDGDGWLDLAVTNFAHDYYSLYRTLDGRLFQDHSFTAGVAVPTFAPLGWGVHFLDAENDGDLDLFFANGHIYPQVDEDPGLHESYRQRNLLLLNESGKFRDATAEAGDGLEIRLSTRGSAAGDLDNDGDVDVVASNQDERPTYLENRTELAGRSVLIELFDPFGTRQALGARVQVEAAGRSQVRQVLSGGSYVSQNDMRLHFGLGDLDRIDRVVVRWLDGVREEHRDLPTGRWYGFKRAAKPFERRFSY
jgi:hypothetical protein